MNKIYKIELQEDQATVLWWALEEKQRQLSLRAGQFVHMNWPVEAKNSALWEANKIKEVQDIMRREHDRLEGQEEIKF